MQSRKISLTGFIEEKWLADGSPRLTWAELLKRTIDADVQLERLGFNPAPAFRDLRYDKDQSGMYTYINGFYQSPFAPNYRARRTAKSDRKDMDTSRQFAKLSDTHQRQQLPSQSKIYGDFIVPTESPSVDLTCNVARALDLSKLYRRLCDEHPHHILPLETSLPLETRFDCRNQFRIIMTMILSGSMGDLPLVVALDRFFNRYKSFDQFRGITKTELRDEKAQHQSRANSQSG